MFRKSSLLFAVIVTILFFGCPEISENDFEHGKGNIRGAITDPEGKPVASANIFIQGNMAFYTNSDQDGKFLFKDVPAGKHIVVAYADSGLGASAEATVFANKETPLKMKLAPTGKIKGRVTLSGEKDHIGTIVYLIGTSFVAYTDHQGNFSMFYVVPGCYSLRAEHDGYVPKESNNVCVESGKEESLPEFVLSKKQGAECGSDEDCLKNQKCKEGKCMFEGGFSEEKCDGVDNNGDGMIDENLVVLCGTDIGECQFGIKQCLGGKWTECLGEKKPGIEICGDGLDNDCNGQSDEGCGKCLLEYKNTKNLGCCYWEGGENNCDINSKCDESAGSHCCIIYSTQEGLCCWNEGEKTYADPACAKYFHKVDILLVLDDSHSVCRIHHALVEIYDWVFEVAKKADFRIAVTTTNVCPKEHGGIRGKFIYSPAKTFPPDCLGQRKVACLTDADCQADQTLPDSQNWVCNVNNVLHICDQEPGPIILDSIAPSCRYRCDKENDKCTMVFGSEDYQCVYPGDNKNLAGCQWIPPTSACPSDGPTVLDQSTIEKYLKLWKDGIWKGEPQWKGKKDEEVRLLIAKLLFQCMTTISMESTWHSCGMQEQGLLAAWMALDPEGENALQAKSFLRPDAVLIVVIVSDEDDCSSTKELSPDYYAKCPCLADSNGCKPDGECGVSKGPLYPVIDLANKFKSLKSDLSRIVFAAVTGDVIPGSKTTPTKDVEAARTRYYECMCSQNIQNISYPYICASDFGTANLGSRYIAIANIFGKNGFVMNLCDPIGTRKSLIQVSKAAGIVSND